MRFLTPQKRRAGDQTRPAHLTNAQKASHLSANTASVHVEEKVTREMRLSDLCELQQGLCRQLIDSYERGDRQTARSQITHLEKCESALKELMR